jgi:hypothetical protein
MSVTQVNTDPMLFSSESSTTALPAEDTLQTFSPTTG